MIDDIRGGGIPAMLVAQSFFGCILLAAAAVVVGCCGVDIVWLVVVMPQSIGKFSPGIISIATAQMLLGSGNQRTLYFFTWDIILKESWSVIYNRVYNSSSGFIF